MVSRFGGADPQRSASAKGVRAIATKGQGGRDLRNCGYGTIYGEINYIYVDSSDIVQFKADLRFIRDGHATRQRNFRTKLILLQLFFPFGSNSLPFPFGTQKEKAMSGKQLEIFQRQAIHALPELRARLEERFADSPSAFACALSEILTCSNSLLFVEGILNEYGNDAAEDFVESLMAWAIKRGRQWTKLTRI